MSQQVKVFRALQFYYGGDKTLEFDSNSSSTIVYVKPATDATEYLAFGDGTTNMDVKMFGGNGTSDFLLWDESENQLKLDGTVTTLNIGDFTGSTSGTGIVVSASRTAAFKVFTDDGNAAIGSGSLVRGGWFRNLQVYTSGNREQESCGVQGSLVSVAGTNRHNMCGVLGSYEARTSLTVDGQASSTDPWIQAGVIGRVGMSSGTLTVNQYGRLCGLAAMSNIATGVSETYTGVYTGVYVGRWTGTDEFEYAIYAEDVQHGIYMNVDSGTVSGEEHGWDLDYAGTLSSGDSLVGVNVEITPAGTAGTWVAGVFAKVSESAKHVNGYFCGAEFEVNLTGAAWNPPDNATLVLNYNNSITGSFSDAHSAWIYCRDYGTTEPANLIRLYDTTKGTTDSGAIVSSVSDGFEANCLVTVRMMYGTTPLYLLATETAPT